MTTDSKHARFSPSKLPRIIQCPGSVKLIEALNPVQLSSSAADEGTYLHAVTERHLTAQQYCVTTTLHDDFEKHQEYKEAVEDILSWVFALKTKHAEDKCIEFIEQTVTLASYAEQDNCPHLGDVYGTADYIFVAGTKLYVCDWKFGKGVVVEPDSDQLKAYATGALGLINQVFHEIEQVIIQPRLPYDTVKTVSYTKEDLTRWRLHELNASLNKVDNDVPVLNPSVYACKWCPLAKDPSLCRARYDLALQTASEVFAIHAKVADTPVSVVSAQEISDILSKTPMLDQYIKDLNNYALFQLASGKQIPGYKLVRGRSLRQWASEDIAKEELESLGYDISEFSEVKFFSPAKVEKVIGKKKALEVLAPLVIKPEGKITLAVESDKRPAISCAAETVFAEFGTEN